MEGDWDNVRREIENVVQDRLEPIQSKLSSQRESIDQLFILIDQISAALHLPVIEESKTPPVVPIPVSEFPEPAVSPCSPRGEDSKKKNEEESKRKREEESKKKEVFEKRKEEENKKKQELIEKKKEEEARRKQELTEKKREEETKKKETLEKKKEAMDRKREEEARKKQEALDRKKEEETKRRELIEKKKHEDKEKQETLKRKKEEEERTRKENFQRKKEEEKLKKPNTPKTKPKPKAAEPKSPPPLERAEPSSDPDEEFDVSEQLSLIEIELGQLSEFSSKEPAPFEPSPQCQESLNSLKLLPPSESFIACAPPPKTAWAISLFLSLIGISIPTEAPTLWAAWKEFFDSIQDQERLLVVPDCSAEAFDRIDSLLKGKRNLLSPALFNEWPLAEKLVTFIVEAIKHIGLVPSSSKQRHEYLQYKKRQLSPES